AAAPVLEPSTGELSAAVRDKMLGQFTNAGNNRAKELAHAVGCRLSFAKSATEHAARKMIDHDGQPPAERPELQARKGQPRSRKAGGGRHRGEVHMPDMVRPFGADAPGRTALARPAAPAASFFAASNEQR